MQADPVEIYRPRVHTNLGIWREGGLKFKIYGLAAQAKIITDEMQTTARDLVDREVLSRIETMGDSNGLGFIIIHPGETGLTISVHWWAQGSVLCQHIYRKLYTEDLALDTIQRPAVACVWELALINAEQEAWRNHMMISRPDPNAYLEARPRKSAA